MKKTYINPEIEVVELKIHQQLMTVSGFEETLDTETVAGEGDVLSRFNDDILVGDDLENF